MGGGSWLVRTSSNTKSQRELESSLTSHGQSRTRGDERKRINAKARRAHCLAVPKPTRTLQKRQLPRVEQIRNDTSYDLGTPNAERAGEASTFEICHSLKSAAARVAMPSSVQRRVVMIELMRPHVATTSRPPAHRKSVVARLRLTRLFPVLIRRWLLSPRLLTMGFGTLRRRPSTVRSVLLRLHI